MHSCEAGPPSSNIGAGAAAPTPAVYWMSSPTYANETLLVAGAGLSGTSAVLCKDAACSTTVATPAAAVSWEQSVQLVLPLTITAPLFLRISAASALFYLSFRCINLCGMIG